MWRVCMILALLSGYFLLIEGNQRKSVENVSGPTQTLSQEGPAAIMFGNPRPTYFGRHGWRQIHGQDKKYKSARSRQRNHRNDPTRVTTKRSFKRKYIL
ncbi:uncharacterized protein Dvir_GJ25616 [Drosophila virilis]|uniref:Secreted protein n=1 Tax=Drosophila virilis TaxID=7244 RepID=A0A0Q9WDK8_DROVI|nr:uncharacterized protein Dvir_GJ25616 [Drosophila virilis]